MSFFILITYLKTDKLIIVHRETGENPVRARRREMHLIVALHYRNSGQSHWITPRRRATGIESKYLTQQHPASHRLRAPVEAKTYKIYFYKEKQDEKQNYY